MMLKRSPAAAGPTGNDRGPHQPLRLLRGSLLLLCGLPLLFAAAPSSHAQERLDGMAPVAPVAPVAPAAPPPAVAATVDGAAGMLPAAAATADGASGPPASDGASGSLPGVATADGASGAVPAVYRSLPPAFREVPGLSSQALTAALGAVSCARSRGVSGNGDLLTIIDYSLPSVEPRLWVLDLARGKVLFHELVAHGAGSGENYATRFSNAMDSRQTSLGLFRTGSTYEGGKGYSLKLEGLDAGRNDRAEERRIVMHGAWYVSADQARRYGRLGRSWGCPALSVESVRGVIDTIKDGTFVFSYAAPLAGGAPAGTALARSSSSPASCPAAPAPTQVTAALR